MTLPIHISLKKSLQNCSNITYQFFLFWFQVWKFISQDFEGVHYEFVNSTTVKSVQGAHTYNVSSPIYVEEGWRIGFQFFEPGLVPWVDMPCYDESEQMYFLIRPDAVTDQAFITYDFQVTPLSRDPCRLYSFAATIGKLHAHVE